MLDATEVLDRSTFAVSYYSIPHWIRVCASERRVGPQREGVSAIEKEAFVERRKSDLLRDEGSVSAVSPLC